LLVGDHLGAHLLADTLKAGMSIGVYLFFLAPHTSHMNQPLEEAPLASLKWYATTDNVPSIIDSLMTGRSARETLLDGAYVTERRTLTPLTLSVPFGGVRSGI